MRQIHFQNVLENVRQNTSIKPNDCVSLMITKMNIIKNHNQTMNQSCLFTIYRRKCMCLQMTMNILFIICKLNSIYVQYAPTLSKV